MAAKHLGGAWPQKGLGPERRRAGQRRGLPGTMRGFLWPTEFLVFSDFLVADPHAHGALQLSVGIDGSPRVWLDGAWRRAGGVLIETDTAHAFDCPASTACSVVRSANPKLAFKPVQARSPGRIRGRQRLPTPAFGGCGGHLEIAENSAGRTRRAGAGCPSRRSRCHRGRH